MEIKPMRTEQDYQAALRAIELLMDAAPGSAEEDRLDVLATGVEPGDQVTLEFGQNRILVTLPITDPQKNEDLALRLTLRYLGDAARVKAESDPSTFNQAGWKVGIYPVDSDSPAGYLFFPRIGEFLPELSTRIRLFIWNRRGAS